MFVRTAACQHVEMSFDLPVLFRGTFPPVCHSLSHCSDWLFDYFIFSVAQHHLINNDWLIDFSFSVSSINPLSFLSTFSLRKYLPRSRLIQGMIFTFSLFRFLSHYPSPLLLSSFLSPLLTSSVCPAQHAMMLPVLTHHIRYHQCLMHLDKLIGYVFKERCLLQVRHSPDSLTK